MPEGTVSSPCDLAIDLWLSRPTVSNLLRDMEHAGLVTREASATDRRRVEVRASPRALRLLERFDRASAAILTEVLAGLDDADRAALAEALPALERLRDAVQGIARENAQG